MELEWATRPSAPRVKDEGPDRQGNIPLGPPMPRGQAEEDGREQHMNDAANIRPGAGGRLAELTAYECWGLLDSEEIARVAWNGREGVAVVPVNYTVADGALWFRTGPHSALGRECGGQRLAVEVDRIDPATRSGWSVVVSGVGELVDAANVSEMLTDLRVWPAGTRPHLIRVEPVEVTGRKLLPAPTSG